MFRLIDWDIYQQVDHTQPLTNEFMSRFIVFYLDEGIIRHIKTIVPGYDNLTARYPTLDIVFSRFGEKNLRKIFDWVLWYINGENQLKNDD